MGSCLVKQAMSRVVANMITYTSSYPLRLQSPSGYRGHFLSVHTGIEVIVFGATLILWTLTIVPLYVRGSYPIVWSEFSR